MVQVATDTVLAAVCGAAGRMGKEVVKAILGDDQISLACAVDHSHAHEDAALVAGLQEPCRVAITTDLDTAIRECAPQVVVDFTTPHTVFENAKRVLSSGIYSVIGTTGLSEAQMAELGQLATENNVAVLIAPNFALGAVLMMKFAQEASRYFDHAEIIEMHHNQKLDAPSGTAVRTVQLMEEAQAHFSKTNIDGEKELIPGARGAETKGKIHVHSVRLPGYVAHQEVIFGAPGQTLTIRHDSLDRISFMPGVLLAVKRIIGRTGLIYGLEHLL